MVTGFAEDAFWFMLNHNVGWCDENVREKPAAWYRVGGTGRGLRVTGYTHGSYNYTMPNQAFRVLVGDDCDALECAEWDLSDEVDGYSWMSVSGEQYFVVVQGLQGLNDDSTFSVSVRPSPLPLRFPRILRK